MASMLPVLHDSLLITARVDVSGLSRALQVYANATRKSMVDVVRRQALNFLFHLTPEVEALAPGAGQVTNERLQDLKIGGGIRVHRTARAWAQDKFSAGGGKLKVRSVGRRLIYKDGKPVRRADGTVEAVAGVRMNQWQAAVRREMALRESARGYAGKMTKWLAVRSKYGNMAMVRNKSGSVVASSELVTQGWQSSEKIEFSRGLGFALSRARGRIAVRRALDSTTADIMSYVDRMLLNNARTAGLLSRPS